MFIQISPGKIDKIDLYDIKKTIMTETEDTIFNIISRLKLFYKLTSPINMSFMFIDIIIVYHYSLYTNR